MDYLSPPDEGGKYAARLDLISTYIEMNLHDEADELLVEVEASGNATAMERAQVLRSKLNEALRDQ